jgi:hypothetical protein
MTREFNGNQMKWTFTGTVAGDEMKLKRAGDGASRGSLPPSG